MRRPIIFLRGAVYLEKGRLDKKVNPLESMGVGQGNPLCDWVFGTGQLPATEDMGVVLKVLVRSLVFGDHRCWLR